MPRLSKCLIAAVLALAATATPATAQTADGTIYGTQLENGWQDWSWAKVERGLEIEGSARKPIRVEAGAYQALFLHHDPMPLKGFTKLHFLLQGSQPGGKVKVTLLSGGKPVNDGAMLTLKNTGWTDVQLPLSGLGGADKPIDGIWISNPGGEPLPPFYVTEIKFM